MVESLLANTTLMGARNADASRCYAPRCKMVLRRSALCGMSNARQPKQPPVSALIARLSRLIVRGGSQRELATL